MKYIRPLVVLLPFALLEQMTKMFMWLFKPLSYLHDESDAALVLLTLDKY